MTRQWMGFGPTWIVSLILCFSLSWREIWQYGIFRPHQPIHCYSFIQKEESHSSIKIQTACHPLITFKLQSWHMGLSSQWWSMSINWVGTGQHRPLCYPVCQSSQSPFNTSPWMPSGSTNILSIQRLCFSSITQAHISSTSMNPSSNPSPTHTCVLHMALDIPLLQIYHSSPILL